MSSSQIQCILIFNKQLINSHFYFYLDKKKQLNCGHSYIHFLPICESTNVNIPLTGFLLALFSLSSLPCSKLCSSSSGALKGFSKTGYLHMLSISACSCEWNEHVSAFYCGMSIWPNRSALKHILVRQNLDLNGPWTSCLHLIQYQGTVKVLSLLAQNCRLSKCSSNKNYWRIH